MIASAFSGIDAAFGRSTDRLWSTVVGVLRARLTGALIPTDTDDHSDLAAFATLARQHNARKLAEATEWLLSLHVSYGSIFFRAGLPVLRTLTWYEPGGHSAADPVGPDQLTSYWHDKLRGDIERTTAELQQELRAEAQRAPRILAAAIHRFSDMTTAGPGIEVEFEAYHDRPARDLAGRLRQALGKVSADLAALGQRAYEASAAADQIASLIAATRRL